MKAIVVQKEKNKTYIMTEKGEFKCLKNFHDVDIGEAIYLPDSTGVYKSLTRFIIAASLIFALLFAFINFKTPQVYAYVYIDINPSIEVSIDRKGKIIDATPLNEEAKKILDNLPYKGLDISSFITKTVEESQKLGFLKEEDIILITTVTLKNSSIISEDIEKAVNTIKNTNSKIQIETLKSTEMQREEAKKEKISPGKLILWEDAKEKGIEIPKDKLNSPEFFKELKQAYTKMKEKETEPQKASNIENQKNNSPNVKITNEKPIKIDSKKVEKKEDNQKIKIPNVPEKKEQTTEDKVIQQKEKNKNNSEKPPTPENNINDNDKPEIKKENVPIPNPDKEDLKDTEENNNKNSKEIKNYPQKDEKDDEKYNEK
ncbi:MAG TPA: anti-sigma factor domain-containing protein [Clostridia bacterium]|nr:anti-sigma factor domain-containing protein [Clostridia bacterium]